MVSVPRIDHKGRAKQGRNDPQTMQSLKHALATFKRNGQPFAAVGLDANGDIQVHDPALISHERFTGLDSHDPDTVTEQSADAFADDEFNLLSLIKPGTRLVGPSIHGRGRDRGRSRPSYDVAEPTTHPYPQDAAVLPSDAHDELPFIPKKRRQRFEIQDTAAVINFFDSRLKKMQQLAVKKIAKAWIKGICPKKQANFPYQNKKRIRKVGLQPIVPGWWPDASVCRFIEPDHIMREERVGLCIHLLRLRPSPEQLRIWNGDKVEPHPTHIYQGWTAFLKELAGPEILDELPRESKCKTDRKRELVQQMYKVAQMEVDYLEGGIDGTDVYSYEDEDEDEDEENYSYSPTLKRTCEVSVDSPLERASRQSSLDCMAAKRARRASSSESAKIIQPDRAAPVKDHDAPRDPIEHGPKHEQYDANSFEFPTAAEPSYESAPADSLEMGEVDRQSKHTYPIVGQYGAAPMKIELNTHSHAITHCAQQRHEPVLVHHNHHLRQQHWLKHDPLPQQAQLATNAVRPRPHRNVKACRRRTQEAQSSYLGQQDLTFPQYPAANMIQVQQVNQGPVPNFYSVPNTSIYSPPTAMAMQENAYVPHNFEQSLPQDQAYTTTLPSNQFLVPASADIGVANFRSTIPDPRQHQTQDPAPQPSTLLQAYQTPQAHQQSAQQFPYQHQAQHSHQHQYPAERQFEHMQYGGLPFTQPVQWSQDQ